MSYGVGHRCGSYPALLWLWLWLAAIALIQPLAQEFPYATGSAKKKPSEPQTIDKENGRTWHLVFHPSEALLCITQSLQTSMPQIS